MTTPAPPFGTPLVPIGASRRSMVEWAKVHPMVVVVIVLFVVFDSAILLATVGGTSSPNHGLQAGPPATISSPLPLPAGLGTASSPTPPATTPPTTTAAATGPLQCTPSDGTITTTTNHTSYPAGSDVTATSTVRDSVACVLDPHRSAPYNCGVSLAVVNSSGDEVFPASGQGEQCSQPPPTTLSPGMTESVSFVWTKAPQGTFTAAALWSWNGPNASQPYTVYSESPTFTVG